MYIQSEKMQDIYMIIQKREKK